MDGSNESVVGNATEETQITLIEHQNEVTAQKRGNETLLKLFGMCSQPQNLTNV